MYASQAAPSTSKTQPFLQQPHTFEFTKRKRWADLLINELSEAIIFVLSPTCKIMYTGTAVTELLGWRDDDLVDGEFGDLLSADDQPSFRTTYESSLRSKQELLSYVHLKCKSNFSTMPEFTPPPTEVLVELTGRPYFVEGEDDCKCFFAVAKPYPSRNTDTLNTLLDLKIENEHLQQRLIDLRSRAPGGNEQYSAAGMRTLPQPMTIPSQRPPSSSNGYYQGRNSYPDIPGPSRGGISNINIPSFSGVHSNNVVDDGVEDGSSKKKAKKSHNSEQYVCVTCGRTDSPEWRKGPHGPKTLCNACGLRWAKQMRKIDDENGEESRAGPSMGPRP